MEKRNLYKLILFLCVLIGFVSIFIIYIINFQMITRSLDELPDAKLVVLIILTRICILTGNSIYMYFKWFKQEEQYTSDIPFLFATFFLLLTFGKAIDLFFDLTYTFFNEIMNLMVIKLRFLLIIFTVLPLIYLSFVMILYSLSLKDRFIKLKEENYQNKVNLIIIIFTISIELFLVLIVPNATSIAFLLPCVVIPSLLIIIWLFAFAYRHKRLSQVNSLILLIGFSLYLASQIIRPLIQEIIGENAFYINLAEIIDLIIFIIIFLGFYMNANSKIPAKA
ncbi:MAG: hypothetical protein ACFFCI_12785 [Promethearchaeota archaeon]